MTFASGFSTFAQPQFQITNGILMNASDNYPALKVIKPNQTNPYLEFGDGTNIYFSVSATGGVSSVINSNFVGAQLYTNASGKTWTVSCMATYTTGAATGEAGVSLKIAGSVTNTVGQSTTGSTAVNTFTNMLSGVVTNGGTYIFTNNVGGAGNSASISGGQILQN